MNLSPGQEQAFRNGIIKPNGEDACWPWIKGKRTDGYGQFCVGRKRYGVHRIALELSGVSVPDNALVLHSCDNKICCNPKHLSIGNTTININECILRKRGNRSSGQRGKRAKLTEEQVKEIRSLSATFSLQELSHRFNVTKTMIHFIVTYHSWKSI